MGKKILFLITILLCNGWLGAQKLDHILGEFLVQVEQGNDISRITQDFTDHKRTRILSVKRYINKDLNVWLLSTDPNQHNEIKVLNNLRKHHGVMNAQFNHLLQKRERDPNDARFSEQWYHKNTGQLGGLENADIGTTVAWNYTTGGTTAGNNEIVVAVIDDGINVDHVDLANNIWINKREIPQNGIDDDLNGYIDDYYGWNLNNENGELEDGVHGNLVSGLIGAEGNNAIGISGVNWNVKTMMVQYAFEDEIPESVALSGYSYILDQRKLYNQTNGRKGAFVVATNASWGLDNKFPSDAPIWCSFYDSLGAHGILNVGATTNNKVNIDDQGDLPSTCPSNYLIAVTNSDNRDKLSDAGFGVVHIDLSAPGEDIISARGANGYGYESGTSFSAPLVAGAIGLLYSAPCYNFAARAKRDPAGTALEIREILLNSVKKFSEWELLLASSGRLDVGAAMEMLMANCGACPAPVNFTHTTTLTDSSNTIDISFNITDTIDFIDARWKSSSDSIWVLLPNVVSPVKLENLLMCHDYEIQFRTGCQGDTTDFGESYYFVSAGCCDPTDIEVNDLGSENITISWAPIAISQGYNTRIRLFNTTSWLEFGTQDTFFTFSDLLACTVYEVQMRSICNAEISDWSHSKLIKTLGCSSCRVMEYCPSVSLNSENEWIDSISIGSIQNQSGDNDGYGNFSTDSEIGTDLAVDSKYRITLFPGFKNKKFQVLWRVWIDYNQDLDLDDEGELVLESISGSDTTFTGVFQIPKVDTLGNTLMRVSMKTLLIDNIHQRPCDTLDFGEVEDYCVRIVKSLGPCGEIFELEPLSVTNKTLSFQWDSIPRALAYLIRYKKSGEDKFSDWELTESDSTHTLSGLKSCTEYAIEILTVCEVDTSISQLSMMTDGNNCTVGLEDFDPGISDLQVFPNPFLEYLDIHLILDRSLNLDMQLFEINGRLMKRQTYHLNPGAHHLRWNDLYRLPQGIYFLQFVTPKGKTVKKIVRS